MTSFIYFFRQQKKGSCSGKFIKMRQNFVKWNEMNKGFYTISFYLLNIYVNLSKKKKLSLSSNAQCTSEKNNLGILVHYLKYRRSDYKFDMKLLCIPVVFSVCNITELQWLTCLNNEIRFHTHKCQISFFFWIVRGFRESSDQINALDGDQTSISTPKTPS